MADTFVVTSHGGRLHVARNYDSPLDEHQRRYLVFSARIAPELERLSLDQLRKYFAADIAAAVTKRKETVT